MGKIGNWFNRVFRRQDSAFAHPGDIKSYVDRITADGILLNELPSPTEAEAVRGAFIRERLQEFGVENINTDEAGNIYIVFPSNRYSEKYFLIYTDIDNMKYSPSGSIVNIKDMKLSGIGIGDNSIGAAALVVLCEYIKKTDTLPDFNLLVLFSLRNTPETNFMGINHFLARWNEKISGAAYLFGLHLGRIVQHSTGICNLSFHLKSGKSTTLGNNYVDSSVDLTAYLYNEISKVDWSIYNTIVNIVRITAGIGFEYFPAEGTIDLEVFAPDSAVLNRAREMIIELTNKVAQDKNFSIENKTVANIPPANDALNETLNNLLKKIHSRLNIATITTNIPDYSAIINQFGIPSVSIGLATGTKTEYLEYIETRSIHNGFKQVLLFLEELNKAGGQAGLHG